LMATFCFTRSKRLHATRPSLFSSTGLLAGLFGARQLTHNCFSSDVGEGGSVSVDMGEGYAESPVKNLCLLRLLAANEFVCFAGCFVVAAPVFRLGLSAEAHVVVQVK
jgi:hypothetical protein